VDSLEGSFVLDCWNNTVIIEVRAEDVTKPGLQHVDNLLPTWAQPSRKSDHYVGGVISLHGNCQKLAAREVKLLGS
jgi:hypothetical protein